MPVTFQIHPPFLPYPDILYKTNVFWGLILNKIDKADNL